MFVTDIRWTKKEESLVLSSRLGLIIHLSSREKNRYWVRNIAKLGKNSSACEITWTVSVQTKRQLPPLTFNSHELARPQTKVGP